MADRRVQKTKNLIEDVLINLLETKNINTITVTEVCKLADINRGTFYLHYADVFDLFEQLQSELLNDFYQILNKYEIVESTLDKSFPILTDIAIFVKEKSKFFKIFLNKNNIDFNRNLTDKFLEYLKYKSWIKFYHSDDNLITYEYYYTFIITGIIGIITKWLNSGLKESCTEIADMMEEFCLTGFESII